MPDRRPPRRRSAQRPAERGRTSDPVRLAAYTVMRAVADGAYANLELPRCCADKRIDGRDAAFATELVYGATRMRGLLRPGGRGRRAADRLARDRRCRSSTRCGSGSTSCSVCGSPPTPRSTRPWPWPDRSTGSARPGSSTRCCAGSSERDREAWLDEVAPPRPGAVGGNGRADQPSRVGGPGPAAGPARSRQRDRRRRGRAARRAPGGGQRAAAGDARGPAGTRRRRASCSGTAPRSPRWPGPPSSSTTGTPGRSRPCARDEPRSRTRGRSWSPWPSPRHRSTAPPAGSAGSTCVPARAERPGCSRAWPWNATPTSSPTRSTRTGPTWSAGRWPP